MKRPILMILILTLSIVPWLIAPPTGAGAPPLLADNASGTAVDGEGRETTTVDQTAPPNIMIPDPLFTFETVVDGTEVVHDFRVYNRGKGDLAIEKVQTG
jgi:hypothetical protein